MFGIGPLELALVAIVAIVFIGPQKLPEMMSKFGKLFVQVRRQTQDIRTGFNDVIRDAERDLELDRIRELKTKLDDVKPANMLENALKDTVNLDDDKDDYHDSHYKDGEYQGDGEGFVDAKSFLAGAKERDAEILKPKPPAATNEVPAGSAPPSPATPSPAPPPPATQAQKEQPATASSDQPPAPPPMPPKPKE